MYLLFQYPWLGNVLLAKKEDKKVEPIQERCRSHPVADHVAKLHKIFSGFGSNLMFYIQNCNFCKIDVPFPAAGSMWNCVFLKWEGIHICAPSPPVGPKIKRICFLHNCEFSKYAAIAAPTLLSFLRRWANI